MPDELLNKKCAELRTAIAGFVSEFPTAGSVRENVAMMDTLCRDLEQAWREYNELSDNREIRKRHSRMKAKLKFLRDSLTASIKACGANEQRREKYREGHEYIGRKLDELASCIPKESRKCVDDTVQTSLEFGSDIDAQQKLPVPLTPSASSAECSFMKRVSEMKVACTNFVQSYPGDELSVVGYIRDISHLLIGIIENLWRKYCRNDAPERIRGIYRCLRVEKDNVASYVGMARMICDFNHLQEQYGENLSYVEKKLSAMLEAFPEKCREVSEMQTTTVAEVEARTPRKRRSPSRKDGGKVE